MIARSFITLLAVSLAGGVMDAFAAASATASTGLDFMLGQWTGSEHCRDGFYRLAFNVQRDPSGALAAQYSAQALAPGGRAGSGTVFVNVADEDAVSITVTRSPSQGAVPAAAGDKTRFAFHANTLWGSLMGSGDYARSKRAGSFVTKGLQIGPLNIPLNGVAAGHGQVAKDLKRITFQGTFRGPDGPDMCTGQITKRP